MAQAGIWVGTVKRCFGICPVLLPWPVVLREKHLGSATLWGWVVRLRAGVEVIALWKWVGLRRRRRRRKKLK